MTWWESVVAVLVVLAAIGALVLTNETWAQRVEERALVREVHAADRFVDVGVTVKIVVHDPHGQELLPGKPRLRVVGKPRHFGGVVDTKAVPPRIVGPSQCWDTPSRRPDQPQPRIWYMSEAQAQIALHNYPVTQPDKMGQLVYGSEGAGKTRCLAYWHYFRWLEHLGENREGGQTAPTAQRLNFVRLEMLDLFASDWYTYKVSDACFVMCDGTRIQLVSTYRQSKAQGSPIQGFNWSWCGRDEGQDQVEVHEDIVSRGRSARGGGELYHQLITATAKDNSEWKTLRDILLHSGKWIKRGLSIYLAPFVSRQSIDDKAATMSAREALRRFGRPDGTIDDLPPELAVYHAWSRDHNLIPIPQVGWIDCTAQELAPWGSNIQALVGHDPGSLNDVSIVLKAYRAPRERRPRWFVVDEITTRQTTTESHVAVLLDRMRDQWGLNLLDRHNRLVKDGPQFMVRADPYGNTDTKPDRSCYTVFRQAGILLHPAAYSRENPTQPGRVPKREGIEMVNTLLCNSASDRRLFIARNQDGAPAAPMLLAALEQSRRNERGEAETERKDKHDLSHWPAALRYALWAIERPRLQALANGAIQ